MFEKFDFYDVVTSLLHGILFLAACFVLFPQVLCVVSPLNISEFALSMVFIALAYFVGQIIISISSIIQPFLFWTFGGIPSVLVFNGQFPDKYLSSDMIERVRTKLQNASSGELSEPSLFKKAMGIARKADGSLAERHNQMYAYNRATCCNLLLIFALFVLSCYYGFCMRLGSSQIVGIILGFVLLLLLHWYRAKQRAFYWVREVLVVAERELPGDV